MALILVLARMHSLFCYLTRHVDLQFARRGLNVVLISRTLSKLEASAKEIGMPH